jgi:hypothetical protein
MTRRVDLPIIAGLLVSALLVWSLAGSQSPANAELEHWVIFISAGFAAWRFESYRLYIATLVLILIAVVFNPIAPILKYHDYDRWAAIALILSAALQYAANRQSIPPEKGETTPRNT